MTIEDVVRNPKLPITAENEFYCSHYQDLGCYTCKNIGLRCDGILSNHDGPNENTPKVCRRCYCLELPCERTKSGTVNGPSQEEALEEIRRRDIRTGKKRARDVSDSSWEA